MSSEETGIRDRLVEFIVHITKASTSRYKEMEKHTGIKSEKWQNVAAKKQRVTEEMLEEIGRKWPEYAYWLMTGATDYDKHVDPGYLTNVERHIRYSTSDQIILTRDPETREIRAHPIQHSIVIDKQIGPVEFDWGEVSPGAVELAANILYHCGLAEPAAIALSKSCAQDLLSSRRKDVAMFSEEEVQDWIRGKTR